MRLVAFLGLTLLFGVTQANAARLVFPEELIPLQVEEQEIEQSFFSKVREIDLAVGTHRVKMKYSDLYEVGYDDHQVIESAPFWALISVASDTTYRISFQRAKTVKAAKAFAKAPKVMLINEAQQAQQTLQVFKVQPDSRSMQPQSTDLKTPQSVISKPAPAATHPDVVGMLNYWWQQATPEQKKLFLQKIKGN
ncbi:DUF2057 family protein [Pseudoalteromonas sp. T1lg65]|uniref:DUF2057 family protein n=1 Tax=Pseudoalteromonas sp. T1lg65 TaxID=2077101 RepID=UPI003F79CFFC